MRARAFESFSTRSHLSKASVRAKVFIRRHCIRKDTQRHPPAIGFPIGATAFLSTDKRGDITLTRMGLTRPRRLRVMKVK
jgi:hypothetical protein